MIWEVDAEGAKRVSEIARAVKGAEQADPRDRPRPRRRGHLLARARSAERQKRALKGMPVERVTFNAITKDAVQTAMRQPARDRPGRWSTPTWRAAPSTISSASPSRPVLWRKLPGARSAGRVQSVALRLVCDRELEIETLRRARILVDRRDARAPQGRRRLRRAPRRRRRQEDHPPRHRHGRRSRSVQARPGARQLHGRQSIEAKPAKRHPYPPFMTSTLQQEASRKLGLAPARTMQLAQRLYEGVDIGGETVGLITYMRTDGVDMAPEAIAARPPRHRQGVRRPLCPGRAAQVHHQGEERPGGARGDPPDRPRPPALPASPAISSPSRRGSTS